MAFWIPRYNLFVFILQLQNTILDGAALLPGRFTCLNPSDRPKWNRIFRFNNTAYPLTVEVTPRPSHQLVSHILAILLRERLGYEKVEFHEVEWDSTEKTLDRLSQLNDKQRPSSFINMEVWIPPTFILEKWFARRVTDCGPLGLMGQVGIYVPAPVVEYYLETHSLLIDHWRTYTNPGILERLLSPTQNKRDMFSVLFGTPLYPCSNTSLCLPVLIDQQVLIKPVQHLIREYFPPETFQIYYSSDLKATLSHKCFTLKKGGDEECISSNQLLRFYVTWRPHSLITSGNFSRIALPDDVIDSVVKTSTMIHDLQMISTSFANTTRDVTLDSYALVPMVDKTLHSSFVLNQFTKLMWSELAKYAPPVYDTITKMKFSHQHMEYLLHSIKLNPNESSREQITKEYQTIACQWLRDHTELWHNWTSLWNKKIELVIGAMFPVYGRWKQLNLIPEAEKAIERLRKDFFESTTYDLVLDRKDVACKDDQVLEAYFSQSYECPNQSRPLLGIVAAVCSHSIAPMVSLATLQHRLVVSPTVESGKFISPGKYPYFFRTVPSMMHYSELLVDLFLSYNWRRVALFRKDDYFLDLTTFQASPVQIIGDYEKEEEHLTLDGITKSLQRMKDLFVRIFVVEYFSKGTGMILCAAAQLNMTIDQGYVWFLNAWLPSRWYMDKNTLSELPTNSCTVKQLKRMVEGHFVLKHYAIPKLASKRLDEMNSPLNRPRRWKNAKSVEADEDNSRLSGPEYNNAYNEYTFEAVYVLGKAAFLLLQKQPDAVYSLHDPSVAKEFRDIMSHVNMSAPSAHGTNLTTYLLFNGHNERTSNIWQLSQMQKGFQVTLMKWVIQRTHAEPKNGSVINTSKSLSTNDKNEIYRWIKVPVGNDELPPHTAALGRLVNWYNPNNVVPGDGTKYLEAQKSSHDDYSQCYIGFLAQFLRLNCSLTTALVFIVAVSILAIICLIRLHHYKRKLKASGPDEFKKNFEQYSVDMEHLDIPSSYILLNRKVGQGAFGLVYGGELKQGDHWQPIAVKMTPQNSSYQTKTDFLQEARLLYDLRHENIVRMYGICLRPQQHGLYLIMEMMKEGDLKTYLCSRRSEYLKDSSHEAYSPQTLTQFALDIAKGLCHLHQCNFIHRDMACRNVLVTKCDNGYIAKIGDFGFTREMQVSQADRYYRFRRNSELPVRWMSPQALNFGRFNVQSDIWAYGIVLYEIITFGAFPYESYSDFDVIDKVKRKELSIVKCLPEASLGSKVYDLIMICSRYEEEDRADSMSIIIKFLEEQFSDSIVRPYFSLDIVRNNYDNSASNLRFAPAIKMVERLDHPLILSAHAANLSSAAMSEDDYDGPGTNRTSIPARHANGGHSVTHFLSVCLPHNQSSPVKHNRHQAGVANHHSRGSRLPSLSSQGTHQSIAAGLVRSLLQPLQHKMHSSRQYSCPQSADKRHASDPHHRQSLGSSFVFNHVVNKETPFGSVVEWTEEDEITAARQVSGWVGKASVNRSFSSEYLCNENAECPSSANDGKDEEVFPFLPTQGSPVKEPPSFILQKTEELMSSTPKENRVNRAGSDHVFA